MTGFSFHKLLLSTRTLLIVWFAVALVGSLLKLSLGVDSYNNFVVFRGVAHHFFEQLPLYAPYPLEYLDVNHYGMLFAILMAPFSYIPVWLSMPLWIVGSTMLLFWSVRSLPMENRWQCVVLWIAVNDLFTGVAMQQFNIMVAALIIGAFALIEKRKEGSAALLIVIGTFVKVYGLIGLAFFFFVERKWRFLLWFVLWSVVATLLPVLFTSWDYVVSQWSAWGVDVAQKNILNQFAGHQNISFVGMIRKVSESLAYSDFVIILPAIALFLLSYLRWRQFKSTPFRLLMLSSVLIFLVIFSSGSENSGYVIASLGVGIWFVTTAKRGWWQWTLLVAVMVASLANNLFPRGIYDDCIFRYALRSIPYTIVWLTIHWELLTHDFMVTKTTEVQDLAGVDIDVVLPCYNPQPDWVEVIHREFDSLKKECPDHYMRLIVANDGSTRNVDEQHLAQLRGYYPDMIFVDNKVNHGKGAVLRSGVRQSDAPLVVYTDIDFPYCVDCCRELIERLSSGGVDIMLAARNHSYHTELSPLRKLLSHASRRLNYIVLGMNYPDAQGGLKGFNGRGRELFLGTKVERFLFDTEFIYKASKRGDISVGQVVANLRNGVHLPAMSALTMRREALNFLKILFQA
ncbi:MAG: glycosyltransferase 87 family protein [Mucinivorans sp.]